MGPTEWAVRGLETESPAGPGSLQQLSLCQLCSEVGFSRPEYESGLPFPPPGDLPNPRLEPASPALAGGFFTTVPLGKSSQVLVDTNYDKPR